MPFGLLRHLLPGSCLLCDLPLPPTSHVDLCRHCLAALPWNHGACPRCGEPGRTGSEAAPCPRCRLQPPPFTLAVAPLRYEAEARVWVGRLKDHLGMVEGRLLGLLLADAAEQRYREAGAPLPDALVPVPLAWRRLARRGHNQALTLALPVARRLRVAVWRRAVVRARPAQPQRGLPRSSRLRNPADTFACLRRWREPGPCLAIVDDVMTTGATAAALARVLLDAGASEVQVLCATRTPAPDGADGATGSSPSHRRVEPDPALARYARW